MIALRGIVVNAIFAGSGPEIDDLIYAGEVPLQVLSFVEGVGLGA